MEILNILKEILMGLWETSGLYALVFDDPKNLIKVLEGSDIGTFVHP